MAALNRDTAPSFENHFGDTEVTMGGYSFQGVVHGDPHFNQHYSTTPQSLPKGVPEAAFNAASKQHTPSCLQDTRCEPLEKLRKWADGDGEKRIYWLRGMAGTGKSTIALIIAREYHRKQQLGASFFFSRGDGDLASTRKYAATIATQLAETSPELCKYIKAAAASTPRLHTLGLYDQWEKLVIEPLSQLNDNPFAMPLVIVIDALDECDDADGISVLVRCLGTLLSVENVKIRVLITSRPERAIKLDFDNISSNARHDLILHDIEQSVINDDLTVFYKQRLFDISQRCFVDENFLSDESIRLFVKRSHGLFIHAATVCRFVGDNFQLANERLLLLSTSATIPMRCMPQSYAIP
ncbi:uncharacterized protein N7479_000452 [Penicillium vulpinum]|uniref:Nephrocystin 3-like N-terminal domain-containing protein n=1 Tax=Penicillium vulpinum TaxID=29845 RepID=A0A1V6S4Q6_9EURO|nr:uncharacterized protein N7479_000452 [Penicillium vulpinum]KAJ5970534.1 hypothetical protein N7479_000452 [Penicillium vulpinum]OQE09047.1 hypothetical protein PENVUL_c007G03527 [Penicillium vulpinum]